MERRILLISLVGAIGGTSGCVSPFAEDVDLTVANMANINLTAEITIGGTVTPVGATTSENGTVYTFGRDKTYFNDTITLDPGETRWFRSIIEASDSMPQTGVTVNLHNGPQRRETIHPGETNEGTVIEVTLQKSSFEIKMID